jgi:hypothetical protein
MSFSRNDVNFLETLCNRKAARVQSANSHTAPTNHVGALTTGWEHDRSNPPHRKMLRSLHGGQGCPEGRGS